MVDHLHMHMHIVSEVRNAHAHLLLNKSLLDGSALQCQGPGSDNKALG